MKTLAKTLLALLLFTALIHPAPADTLIRPGDFPAGLQAWWKFDGNATDASPNHYHLSNVNSPGYVLDDYFATGERSGSQTGANYWTIPDVDCPNLSLAGTAFSIAAWIKMDVIGPNNIILRKWVSNVGYVLRADSAAYPTASTGYLAISFGATEISTQVPVLSAGKWHHVAFVYDKARSLAIFYVDGNYVHSTTHAIDLSDNSEPCDVGYVFPGGFPSLSLKGAIKDLAVWDRTVTPIEVKSLALGVDLQTLAYRPGNVFNPPAGYWKLNEVSSGASAVTRADSSGHGLTLTDNNNVPAATGFIEAASGRFTSASSQYLSRPHASGNPLDIQGAEQSITLMAWIYSSGSGNLIASDVIMDNLAPAGGYTLQLKSPNSKLIEFYLKDSGGNLTLATSAAAVNQNGWHHVAGVYDAAANKMQVYVDGVASGSPVTQSAGIGGSTSEFRIAGRVTSDSTIMWDGYLADVAVFPAALSASQIAAIATGLPVQRSGIVSYWSMDETSGTRVDSIGSNNLSSNNGVGSAPGVVGNAADLEKDSSQFLSKEDTSTLDLTTDFTLASWVKPESTGELRFFLNKSDGFTGYYFGQSSVDKVILVMDGNLVASSTTSLVAGTWYHAVVVWNGSTATVYVNSVNEHSTAYVNALSDNAFAFGVGTRVATTPTFYDGLLDETLVARRWFREEEIKAIYNSGLNGQRAFLPDTDGDGIPDEYETGTGIYVSPRNTGTNPANPDTDDDGLTDGQEVNIYHTNPNLADTDGDGFDDGFEVSTGFDPTNPSNTPEALSSIRVAVEYRFNAALGVHYRIESSPNLITWTTVPGDGDIIGSGGTIRRCYFIEGPKLFYRSRRN